MGGVWVGLGVGWRVWSSYLGLEESFMSWEERVDSRRIGPCKAGNRITWYREGFYRIILTKEEMAFRGSPPLSQPIFPNLNIDPSLWIIRRAV